MRQLLSEWVNGAPLRPALRAFLARLLPTINDRWGVFGERLRKP